MESIKYILGTWTLLYNKCTWQAIAECQRCKITEITQNHTLVVWSASNSYNFVDIKTSLVAKCCPTLIAGSPRYKWPSDKGVILKVRSHLFKWIIPIYERPKQIISIPCYVRWLMFSFDNKSLRGTRDFTWYSLLRVLINLNESAFPKVAKFFGRHKDPPGTMKTHPVREALHCLIPRLPFYYLLSKQQQKYIINENFNRQDTTDNRYSLVKDRRVAGQMDRHWIQSNNIAFSSFGYKASYSYVTICLMVKKRRDTVWRSSPSLLSDYFYRFIHQHKLMDMPYAYNLQ